jgi:hypothetical protein
MWGQGTPFSDDRNEHPQPFFVPDATVRIEHYYYLGLDVFSIAFPLAASFEQRVQYWRK